MIKRLQRILSLLCIPVLCLAAAGVAAEAETPKVTRVVTVEWKDGDNYDRLRPESVKVSLAGREAILSAGTGWAGAVEVDEGTGSDWAFDAPEGYTGTLKAGEVSVITFSHPVAPKTSVSASVQWADGDNAGGIRPDEVLLALLADGEPAGEPAAVKAPAWTASWDKLPKYRPGSDTEIRYTVSQLQDPAGYTASVDGLTVTNTLQTGRLTLNVSLNGVPEGADVSGLKLILDGPDPSVHGATLTFSQLTDGSYDFGDVLPGAYLVRSSNADTLIEGYTMDGEKSRVSDAVSVRAGESAALEFAFTWKPYEAYETEEGYDPLANIGSLSFEILGPDDRMPLTVTYADFTDGKYELNDLAPGVYTVVERNAETLVKYYTLTGASVTGMTLNAAPDGTATATLFNQYVPAPVPEPEAEFVDIPVTKTWNDNNNADGNRPASVTVRLYADGMETDSHALTAAEGWAFTFAEKPRYREDNKTEIVYSVREDEVPMYRQEINGTHIVNHYQPEETSMSVSKVWNDSGNAQGLRPSTIAMMLYDGVRSNPVATVILSEANGWTGGVDHLPVTVNGQPAAYGWKEQEVLGYTLESVEQRGTHMTFTNAVWSRPDKPSRGKKPKTPGQAMYVFEDYDTPLGVEIVINHVGDCFD